MLHSGKKFRTLLDKKNKYSNSRVARKKNYEKTKNHTPPPPFKLNGRSLITRVLFFSPIKVWPKMTPSLFLYKFR